MDLSSAHQVTEEQDKDLLMEISSKGLTSYCAPSNLAHVKFAIDMDDATKALVIDCKRALSVSHQRAGMILTAAVAFRYFNEAMYPTELFKGADVDQNEWGHWLFHDPAYLQCAFFMAFTTRDITENRPITPTTYSHLRETIIHLNRRLSSSENGVALGNSTIATVIILTMFSCIINDHEAAKAHIAGLQQMVRLRGGLQTIACNQKLYLKLGR